MTLDILDALSQQKINAYAHSERMIVDDGYLSVSDEVFKCTMYQLGFDKEDMSEWMLEPIELRHKFMMQWGEL